MDLDFDCRSDRGCSYFLATTLGSLYPKQTLIEFSQTILGKWLGKLLMIPYFFGWYMIIWITVREFGEFIIIALFHNTPLWVIVFTAMLLLIFIIYQGGVEGIGRLSEIIGPIVLLMITFVIILNVGNMNWDYMRPIYHDSGWLPILKGSYTPVAAFLERLL